MIELSSLTKRFGIALALDSVTFTAGAGEVVALLGPNGAGKSTMLKCLLGLLRFEGTARIGGLDVARRGNAARRLTGYVPQAPAFPPQLSTGDALEYYADLRGLRGEDIDGRLEQLGLTAHADKPVAKLSGGLRQRLGLAVALLGDPPVLLMDEPAANLDPEGRGLFTELVTELRGRGRTVLLSTHVVDALERIATRALVLVDGRVSYDGSIAGFLNQHGDAGPAAARASADQAGRSWDVEQQSPALTFDELISRQTARPLTTPGRIT